MDIARVNAQTIHALNNQQNPRKTDSAEFVWKLAASLVIPHMKKRGQGLKANLKSKIMTFLSQNEETDQDKEEEEMDEDNEVEEMDMSNDPPPAG